jgi:hypothetical protein
MDIKRFTRRIRFGDLVYGLLGALLMGVNCYIAAIIYPQMPGFVFAIVIVFGFLAGFFFGSTAAMTILQFLGAV